MLKNSEFFKRFITGAVLTLVCTLVLVFSYIPMVSETAISALAVAGVFEMLRAADILSVPLITAFGAFSVCLIFVRIPYYSVFAVVLLLDAVIYFAAIMRNPKHYILTRLKAVLPVLLFIPAFFKSIVCIRETEYGIVSICITFFIGMFTDIFAYIMGKRFGKHKLASRVSPKKTWEGSVLGTVCGAATVFIGTWIYSAIACVSMKYGAFIPYLFIASVVGQFGDLALSSVKRSVGIKDYGKSLPGHGGILDRFDSLMFIAPFTLFYIFVCDGFFVK